MAIWIDKELTPESTLVVHIVPSVSSDSDLAAEFAKMRHWPVSTKRTPERELTTPAFRGLALSMEAAKIERFDDGFYHGIMNPLDSYDLFCDVTDLEGQIKRGLGILERGFIEFAGFRFARTTAIYGAFLMGKSSRIYNLVDVWLLEAEEVEKIRQQREWEKSGAKALDEKAAQENAGIVVSDVRTQP